MKREDGRKTEQLHIVVSKEEKAAFYQLVAQETKRTGEQYTITRLIKEKVLYSLQESRDRLQFKRMIWSLQKQETELSQAKELAGCYGGEKNWLGMKKVQEEILKNLSAILWLLRDEGE